MPNGNHAAYQNPDLRERLLDTGDAYLEEGNTWGDRVWGCCRSERPAPGADWSETETVNVQGRNLLGQILMKIEEKNMNDNKVMETKERQLTISEMGKETLAKYQDAMKKLASGETENSKITPSIYEEEK